MKMPNDPNDGIKLLAYRGFCFRFNIKPNRGTSVVKWLNFLKKPLDEKLKLTK
jgi:hypothetical protein